MTALTLNLNPIIQLTDEQFYLDSFSISYLSGSELPASNLHIMTQAFSSLQSQLRSPAL